MDLSVETLLLVIFMQLSLLIALIIGIVRWKRKESRRRDAALAETIRITLQRKHELEQIRAKR